jgi:hypothetical protein
MEKLRVNRITPLLKRTTSFKRSTTAILLGSAFRSSPFRSTNTATVPKVRLPGFHFFRFFYYSSHLLVLFLAEEYHQIKEQAAAKVESPPLIEEEIINVDEPNLKIIDATEVLDEARSETTVRKEYANWLIRYGKTTELSNYPTFKKNFLLQEEYNRNFVGQCSSLKSFSLNEYGDCTEGASLRLPFSPFYLLFVSRFGFVSHRGVPSNQGNSSRKGRISSSN